MSVYDIVITGAGPAGLTAAWQLAKNGLSVLVLEKNPEIGIRPIRCGEALGPVNDWPDKIPLEKSWIEAEIESAVVVSPVGNRYQLTRPGLGWAIDKSRFLKWLAKKAQHAGVVVSTASYVNSAELEGNKWLVSFISEEKQQKITGRFFIGADGVESRSGVWTGIRKKRKPYDLCTTAQVHLPLSGYSVKKLYFFVGPKFIPNGYAWIFPGVDGKRNIGVGTLAKNKNREGMDVLLLRFLKQQGIDLPEKEKIVFGGIPFGEHENVIGNRCLLIGDAAGMAYPLSGGGILNSLHAALWASESVVEFFNGRKDALKEYPKRFNKKFKWAFRRELWGRKLLFSCTDKEIDELFVKTKKAMPKRKYDKVSEAEAVIGLLVAGIPFAFKKLFRHLFLLFILSFLFFSPVKARPADEQIVFLKQAVLLGEEQRYDSSFIVFDRFIRENPGEPLGYVLKMNILGLKMLDYESYKWEKTFEKGLSKGIKLADSVLSLNNRSAWALYAKGAALGALSSQDLRRGRFWKGMRRGMKSIDILRQSYNQDSTLYDCYLYLGLYDYVKEELRKKFTGIFSRDRAEGRRRGIRKLETCRSFSCFSRMAAAQTLLGVYAREGKIEKTGEIYNEIIADYKNNRPARWTFADNLFERKEWKRAADVYSQLDSLMAGVPDMADWQLLLCKYRLAYCMFKMKRFEESRKICRIALKTDYEKDRKAKNIEEDILKLLEETGKRRK